MLLDDGHPPDNVEFSQAPLDIQFNSWYAITTSTILWISLYLLCKYLLPAKNPEYVSRILSFIHGLLTAFIGINQCFNIDLPFDHPEWQTTKSQKFLLVCSLGYFVHDFIWLVLNDTSSKLMMSHHAYSVIALYRMLHKEKSGAQATCALGTMEISNPLLQIRWFLRSEGFYPSNIFTAAEITFMIVFFMARIVLGTYFFYVISFQSKNDWDFRILAGLIYVMSWMFMINIAKYFIKKYGSTSKNREMHIKGS